MSPATARWNGTTAIMKMSSVSRTTFRSGTGHEPGRLPRRADADAQQLCGQVGAAEEGEGLADRRGYARGADRHRVGEAARSQILLPDQGQAGLVRRAPAAGKPDGRQDGGMADRKNTRLYSSH